MPVNLQIKLLRVLQEHTLERLGSNQSIPVDCRVIAATKADLAAMGKSGQFRSDLYYRLNVVSLELPALRDRREDILLLFEHFLQQSSLRFDRPAPELDRATVASLMAHDWPGNVREPHISIPSPRLLLVEDDPRLREDLDAHFRRRGFRVTVCGDGSHGLEAAGREAFDLVLLDIMLPGLDGLALLESLRREQATPVMLMSALGAEQDRISGFTRGADDYLPKPFSLAELDARTDALLRRVRPRWLTCSARTVSNNLGSSSAAR